jgi:hypothetical protein
MKDTCAVCRNDISDCIALTVRFECKTDGSTFESAVCLGCVAHLSQQYRLLKDSTASDDLTIIPYPKTEVVH